MGYSLYAPSEPNLFDALGLKNEITSIKGDVRDEKLLCEVFELYQPEIVFHLAAQALVVNSYHEPKLTFETNVMGSVSLFEAARKTKSVKVVVNVTTDKCYENNDEIYEYKETDKMGGYDPYSEAKGHLS
ncbi:MAG: GDP-mannose 4,6-dehydratase [Desulfomicrobium escambiense]|nr:GDP-mannose 4,6-dehydratase [Desulfomicrobium escambiense]